MLMVNVQLQSRIIHFDLRDSYHRSALAKIVSHPDVAGQEFVCGRLSDAGCRRGGDKSPDFLSSGCSIRRRRGDGGAQKRCDKHDRKNGFHDVLPMRAVLDNALAAPLVPRPIKQERSCRCSRGPPIVSRIPSGTGAQASSQTG